MSQQQARRESIRPVNAAGWLIYHYLSDTGMGQEDASHLAFCLAYKLKNHRMLTDEGKKVEK